MGRLAMKIFVFLAIVLSLWAGDPLLLDEAGIRRAMRAEILERVRGLAEGNAGTERDFRTIQAWQAVRDLVEKARSAGENPEQTIFRLADMPAGDPAAADFQGALDEFAHAMTIEYIDSLAFEYNEVDALLGRMLKLEDLLAGLDGQTTTDRADAMLRPLMRRQGIPVSLLDRVRHMGERWREPPGNMSGYQRFSAWRRNTLGGPAGTELKVLFTMGEKHCTKSPFIADFLGQYERLCQRVRETAARLQLRLSTQPDMIQ